MLTVRNRRQAVIAGPPGHAAAEARPRRVLQVIYTDAAWHPAFISTTQLFSERGASVDILFRRSTKEWSLPGHVDFGERVRLVAGGQTCSGWSGRVDYLRFVARTVRQGCSVPYDVIIGYDAPGFVAACVAHRVRPGAKLVYHNFDLLVEGEIGLFSRCVKRAEMCGARRADLVLVSAPGRAKVLQEQACLIREPIVAMNCQRLGVTPRAEGEFRQLLQERGFHWDRIVARLGYLGPGNAVESLVRSVSDWQSTWGLVLVGAPVPGFLEKIDRMIKELRLEKQILVLPSVPYDLWYDILYSADLGIALYEFTNVNNQNMAGAGNKLNLYLKAGIPSIVPNHPDFEALVARWGFGVVTPVDPPSRVSDAVRSVLSDPRKYERLRCNSKRAFEEEFNFEKQFRPLFDFVLTD